MTESAIFRPDIASEADLAVLIVTTVEGQRVSVPFGVNAFTHLRGIVEAGLRVVRARDGEEAQ
ncbi:hypothetical protein [Methylobacterium sp. E-046]|uniref:hypothetical protein n=1 Tax=Methylobacterium sp. E-046 TaxID=2836576 RepID=UPI001FB92C46|nr:hypothetical protein [Methylobacterium sp. E-046]MCJ2102405.1 hypothetical protein [Methylobacterium sp. E-046]